MRRILIDRARAKRCQKRGGTGQRRPLTDENLLYLGPPEWVLSLDEAIERLSVEDVAAAELVRLRFFAGLSVDEAAQVLEISRSSGYRLWTYARAWLLAELCDDADDCMVDMAESSACDQQTVRSDATPVVTRAAR
jgi:RNA polymerase sigma factor (TIGR02999 family)